jgi:hypothetical protein
VHDPLRDYVSFVRDDRGTIVTGVVVFLLGAGFLLWWLAWLRSTLATDARNSRWADAAFAGGITAFGVTFLALAPLTTVAWRGPGGLDPALVRFLVDIAQVAFGVIAAIPFTVLIVAASAALVRSGLGPPWLAWLGWITAIVNAIPVFGLGARSGALAPYGAIGLPGAILFFVWVIATSVLLGWRTSASTVQAGRAAPAPG